MGRKTQEFRPNTVLATAIYSGLSALVWLASKRKNRQTADIFEKIKRKWNSVQVNTQNNRASRPHDFSSVQKVESPLRKLNFRMLWQSTKRYGNKEKKRVYSWKEGTIGELNSLLNYAGATLRDIVVPRYPFPTPQLYEVRAFPNGTEQVFPKDIADKFPATTGVRTHLRAGYRGNSKDPRVLLTHPTLPAMDFGDMIRAHLIELCRQCFIHCVLRAEAHRYIRLLIHRLLPFLDWVYTRGKTGRKNFSPDADRELRKIVLEIRNIYSKHIGTRERISKQVEDVPQNFGIDTLREKVEAIQESSDDSHIKKKCKTILQHIRRGIVTYREVEKFTENVMKRVQQEGNKWHRVLLSGYPQPRSLKEAIFAGDHLLQTPSGIQYLAEVPVTGTQGSGKIDLVLFVRTQWRDRHIWTPVMILEVKTKAGFDFNLFGKRPRTKKPDVFVPVLNAWKKPLRKTEWEATLGSVPPTTHLDQIDVYEKAMLSEYHTLIGETIGFKELWKGVVTLDVSQEFEDTKRVFDLLIDDLADSVLKGEFKGQWKTLTIKDKSTGEPTPRLAITLTPTQGPLHITKSISPLKAVLFEDPFEDRIEDDFFFTQYISLSSPVSSGKSAAWFAKNWHLLNHLAELEKTSPIDTSLIWIDLIGDFPTKKLIEKRFGLYELKKKKLIANSEYTRLSGLLERVAFVSVRDDIDAYLIDGRSSGYENVSSEITAALLSQSENRIVVVDGWSDLESMTPANRKNNLQVLELSLLQIIKSGVNEVIWTDTGVNLSQVCEVYQRNCSSPLYYSSPRKRVIDEILWNVPTAPRKLGLLAPKYEDRRVIIQDLPTEQDPWSTVIHVPHLKGLGRKFSKASVRSPIVNTESHIGDLNQQENMHGRAFRNSSIQVRSDVINRTSLDRISEYAFGIVPSLLRPREGQLPVPIDVSSEEWKTTYQRVDVNSIPPNLSSRLHIDVTREPPHPNRIGTEHEGIYVEAESITRGWIHKETDEEEEETGTITRRPALLYSPESSAIDTIDSRRREIQRLSYATEFLSKRPTSYRSLYREISLLCVYDKNETVTDKNLLDVLTQIREVILRRPEPRRLWTLLLKDRLDLGNLLDTDSLRILKQALGHNPILLELYGMNLFLCMFDVATRVLSDAESSHCITLWSSVSRWQLYQIGFRQKDDEEFEHRYDFQAIHSNLTWRAKQMKKTTHRESTRLPEQYGILLFQEKSDGGNIWLLFPSIKKTIFGALLEDQMGAILRYGWHKGEIDPQALSKSARSALSREGWTEYPIVLVSVNKQHVLYTKDDNEWIQSGLLEYGNPPRGQSQPARWIRLSQPSPETLVALHGYRPGSFYSDVKIECDGVLKEATEWSGIVREVSCLITIDLEKKVYKIDLNEGSKTIARKETPYTDEIIRFLRYPQRIGEYFSTQDGTYLKWDPQRDVEYDEVRIKNKEGKYDFYHLSVFKPLIHRHSFYSDIYKLPTTCDNFLNTKTGEDIILGVKLDDQRKERGFKKYLKVQLDVVREESHLRRFESENMGIFDVALLAECSQLVDVDSEVRYDLEIDSMSLVKLKLVHLLSDYPRLEKSIVGHIEELEDAEMRGFEIPAAVGSFEERDGPEMRFVSGQIEESSRRRTFDVVVHLCNVEDESDFEELTVVSVSSEIVKTQSIAYGFIERMVKRNLRSHRITDDTLDEILTEIEIIFEGKRIEIDYQ
ncbi:MAG: hypothetical protein ACW98U_09895 [Candidatus Thorarchaeota archaeon]